MLVDDSRKISGQITEGRKQLDTVDSELEQFSDFSSKDTLIIRTLVHGPIYMSDICNVIFLRFCDVTKQNGRISVGTLYREPLGVIVVYYDSGSLR